MNVIIIRGNQKCLAKNLNGIDANLEARLRDKFHILSNSSCYGMSDIQTGKKLKEKVAIFSEDAKSFLPLRSIIQYIENFAEDEHIVLVDGDKYSNLDIFIWIKALAGIERKINPIEIISYWKYEVPQRCYPRYDLLMFMDFGYDQYYGEWNKENRRCRFCGKKDSANKKIFGEPKNSHAISYFLGNDTLFCLEECKECNENFGGGIEVDLANYYKVYRAIESRKSREGKPLKVKGFNYEYTDRAFSFFANKHTENFPELGKQMPTEGILLHLDNKEPVCLHNIYRLLVKFVVSCIPNYLLPFFKCTIEWVLGNKKPHKGLLPPVYRIETLENIISPILCVYIRKDNKKDMPYCIGEFRFMENLYIFAVPYCKEKDVMNTYLEKQLANFIAKRYTDIYPDMKFTIENFCDDEPKLITTHVKIKGENIKAMQPLTDEQRKVLNEKWQKRNDKMIRYFGTTDLHQEEKL